ncbi:MAG TPA: hypothetical protein VH370_16890 [Humisphaera sp.]|nr:hypothetical protein [Humisphaera sp.]
MNKPIDYEPLKSEPARRGSRYWFVFLVVLAIPIAWYLFLLAVMGILTLFGRRDWLDYLAH